MSRCLPPAFAPFGQLGALLAQCGVVTVAWVEPCIVRKFVEDPRRHVVDQRGEILRTCCFPDSAGEQHIALTVKILPMECDAVSCLRAMSRSVMYGGRVLPSGRNHRSIESSQPALVQALPPLCTGLAGLSSQSRVARPPTS